MLTASPDGCKRASGRWSRFSRCQRVKDQLYWSTRASTTASFGAPVHLTALDPGDRQFEPTFGPDGLSLFFGSNDPSGAGGEDIWTATRPALGTPFAAPKLFSAASTSAWEHRPFMAHNGLEFFFSRSPDGNNVYHVYRMTRPSLTEPFGAPTLLTEFDQTPDANALGFILSPDGLEAFFIRSPQAEIWHAFRSCMK